MSTPTPTSLTAELDDKTFPRAAVLVALRDAARGSLAVTPNGQFLNAPCGDWLADGVTDNILAHFLSGDTVTGAELQQVAGALEMLTQDINALQEAVENFIFADESSADNPAAIAQAAAPTIQPGEPFVLIPVQQAVAVLGLDEPEDDWDD